MRWAPRIAGFLGALLAIASVSVVSAAGGIDEAAEAGRPASRVGTPATVVEVPAVSAGQAIVDLVNEARSDAGLGAVVWNAQVAAAAQQQADHQASVSRLTHAGPGNSDAGDRLTSAGYRWTSWGETVGEGFDDLVSLVTMWMASPGHRAVILGDSTVGAAALATSASGRTYFTLVKARG